MITLTDKSIEIENDWLGSIPVFYNEKTKTISTLMIKTIDENNIGLHAEGFNNYLDFGYSILEQTPIINIKFLRYYSKLIINKYNIAIKNKNDIALNYLNDKTTVHESLEKINKYINSGENKIKGNIIIPTSGGLDSRMLNAKIKNKKRIRSFTYGVSMDQSRSHEVVRAKKISNILNTKWRQIELGDYNKYYKNWFYLFCCSTHLHGMYHIEFYKKIKSCTSGCNTLLSGIFGDAWSGKVNTTDINTYKDLVNLGYAHGININSKFSLLNSNNNLKKSFINKNLNNLKISQYKIITTIRLKIILISYLMTIPDYLGFPSWTPFLNMETALSMLNLPNEERKNRKWQIDYFKKNNLYFGNMNLNCSTENYLEDFASRRYSITNINKKSLKYYINNKILKKIARDYDKMLSKKFSKLSLLKKIKNKLLFTKYTKNLLNLFNCKASTTKKPYFNIVILKSIELALAMKKGIKK